jgi:hypothetical protein
VCVSTWREHYQSLKSPNLQARFILSFLANAMISLECESLKLTGLAFDDVQKLPLLVYSESISARKNAAGAIYECVVRSHKEKDSASVFDTAHKIFGYSTECAEVVLSSI